jgi:hypothetical protein
MGERSVMKEVGFAEEKDQKATTPRYGSKCAEGDHPQQLIVVYFVNKTSSVTTFCRWDSEDPSYISIVNMSYSGVTTV